MAIDSYSALKTAVSDWMARSDVSGSAADMVTLAEARLNRELPAVVTDVTLTGTGSSRRIDISAHNVVEARRLWLVNATGFEQELTKKQDGDFGYTTDTGTPRYWATDQNCAYIDFDFLLSEAFTFRLRCRQKFALSDSAPTNWLLSNHPDVYLMASLVWGGAYIKDFPYAATFKGALDEAMGEVKSEISRMGRGLLNVDPGLASIGRRNYLREDLT